jgi:hypothetical protein
MIEAIRLSCQQSGYLSERSFSSAVQAVVFENGAASHAGYLLITSPGKIHIKMLQHEVNR